MKNKIREFWEKRSRSYGDKPEGVLPKSYPSVLNESLDIWMYKEIKKYIPKYEKVKILDLGCGYGRLSSQILSEFPLAEIRGIDISQKYVDIYNKKLNPRAQAYQGDITNLKFRNNSFDYIYIVTTLMYLESKDLQAKALKEMFRVLKKNGKIVILERNLTGHKIVTLGGLVDIMRGATNKEIPAVSFKPQDITKLVSLSGGEIINMSAMPIWTLLFPISFVFSKFIPGYARNLLKYISLCDNIFCNLLTPSLYISYSCKKL